MSITIRRIRKALVAGVGAGFFAGVAGLAAGLSDGTLTGQEAGIAAGLALGALASVGGATWGIRNDPAPAQEV